MLGILLAITMPVWLPFLLIGFATEVVFLPREWRFRSRMRKAGRWLSHTNLLHRLSEQTGTLIVEWPTPGWSFSRAWWSDEVVGELPTDPATAGGFIRECHVRFTSPDTGRAMLVAVWNGEQFARRLMQRFENIPTIRYCSFVMPEEVGESES
jgi:hypothetical protein